MRKRLPRSVDLGALALLLLAFQSLWPVPLPLAWQLGRRVTEWGHWLAPPACLLGLALLLRRGTRLAGLACLAAAGLFALPVAWALSLQGEIAHVDWGPQLPGRSPLSIYSLYRGVQAAPYRRTTMKYQPDWELDLYEPEPDTGQAHTCVIVVHGEWWWDGWRQDANTANGLNGYLAGKGFVVAVPDFTSPPDAEWPVPLDDLLAARKFLAAQLPQVTRFVWLGRSSGGQLAMLACYKANDAAVVAFYPPTDMIWTWEHPSNPRVVDSRTAQRTLLGGGPHGKPAAWREASPLIQVASADPVPQTLLIHGMQDDVISCVQSQRFADAYEPYHTRAACHLLLLPWATHGGDLNFSGPTGQLSTYVIERFLAGQK